MNKRIFKYVILFLLICSSCIGKERILVITSFHLNHVWTKKACEKIADGFEKSNKTCIIDWLELNAVLDRDGDYKKRFNDCLPRIKNGEYSIIIGLLDDANALLIENSRYIPQKTAVILCCYRNNPENLKNEHPNFTGFSGEYNLKQTIDLATKLYPRTKEVSVICDDLISGRKLYEQSQILITEYSKWHINIIFGGKYSTQQILKHIENLPEESILIFAPWRNFVKDNYSSLEQIAAEISKRIQHPFFVFTDVLLGHGAIGGYLTDGADMGRAVADMGIRILDGENVSNIPFMEIPVRCVFDMELFNAEKLDRSLIPHDAILINNNPSLLEDYPVASSIIAGMFLLLILALAKIILMYIKFTMEIKSQKDSLSNAYSTIDRILETRNAILDSIDSALIVIDVNKIVIVANAVAGKFTGYTAEGMAGRHMTTLCRTVSKIDNTSVDLPVTQVLETGKPMKVAHAVTIISKDGRKTPIEASIFAIKNFIGEVTGAVIVLRDITTEQIHIKSLSQTSDFLEKAVKMANITCSKVGTVNDIGSGAHARNWGVSDIDGIQVPASEWIHPDDFPHFEAAWKRLLDNEIKNFKIEYRSNYKGKIRYFAMTASLAEENVYNNTPLKYNCVIQDISENEMNKQKQKETTEILKLIIDFLPAMLVIKNPTDNFKIVMANKKFAKNLGRSQEYIIGKTDFELFEQNIAKKNRASDSKVAIAGGIISEKEKFASLDSVLTIATKKTCITTKTGEKYILMVSLDISDLENAKNRAMRSEEIMRAIIDNLPVGLYLKDPDDDYRYVLWNAELELKTNNTIKNIEGKTDFEVYSNLEKADRYRSRDEQVIRTKRPMELVEELSLPDGESIVLRTSLIPICLSDDKQYLLGTFVNITESREISKRLETTVAIQNDLLENEHIHNECLKIISVSENYVSTVEKCLKIIGEGIGADRCFIHCYRCDNQHIDKNFRWIREGSEKSSNWNGIDIGECPELLNRLNTRKFCVINDFSENPEIYQEMLRFLGDSFDIKTMMLYGIYDDSGFYGILGLSNIDETKKFLPNHEKILEGCA